jgi:hypothetical protein
VTVSIVKQLKVVQVHHEHGKATASARSPLEFLGNRPMSGAMVKQLGYRITVGQINRLFVAAGILEGHAPLGSDRV